MKLKLALVVAIAIFALEVAGGVLSHSLALLTDAVHVLTDVGSAALALWAVGIAQRRADARRTFGYGRATVLAALANAVVLLVLTVFIVAEAVRRFWHPVPVEAGVMMATAALAIVANGGLAWFLHRDAQRSLNVRAVSAHVVGDAVISIGVVVGAAAIALTHDAAIDPAVSLLAAFVVVGSAWSIVREAINVLLEGAPRDVDLAAMRRTLEGSLDVREVHDLHVWSVNDGERAASLHVRVEAAQLARSPGVVAEVKHLLRRRYDVTHCTVEVECDDCAASC